LTVKSLLHNYVKLLPPPEYFKHKKYSANGLNAWSLGVLLYEMLFNVYPFVTPYETVNLPLSIPHSTSISLDVRVFLQWMLEKLESKRITIEEIIVHPWVTKKWV
jgi:serine/threonine protein kinase